MSITFVLKDRSITSNIPPFTDLRVVELIRNTNSNVDVSVDVDGNVIQALVAVKYNISRCHRRLFNKYRNDEKNMLRVMDDLCHLAKKLGYTQSLYHYMYLTSVYLTRKELLCCDSVTLRKTAKLMCAQFYQFRCPVAFHNWQDFVKYLTAHCRNKIYEFRKLDKNIAKMKKVRNSKFGVDDQKHIIIDIAMVTDVHMYTCLKFSGRRFFFDADDWLDGLRKKVHVETKHIKDLISNIAIIQDMFQRCESYIELDASVIVDRYIKDYRIRRFRV